MPTYYRDAGDLMVAYNAPDSKIWDELGVKNPGLAIGNYKLQVLDCDNFTSLLFIDLKGQPFSLSENAALMSVFQAVALSSETIFREN